MKMLIVATLGLAAAVGPALAEPASEPTSQAAPAPELEGGVSSTGPIIEILIAGPEADRSRMEEILRSMVGPGPDLRWSSTDRLPLSEALPSPKGDGSAQIWIDVANPRQLRVYLPAQEATGATTIRSVTSQPEQDSELLGRETIAQIVKSAVLALRGQGVQAIPAQPELAAKPKPDFEPEAATGTPPPSGPTARQPVADVGAGPTTREPHRTDLRDFSVVLSAGVHDAPFGLGGSAGSGDWLGPAILGAVRHRLRTYLLALRLSYETSGRDVDLYHLESTYLAGTLGGYRVFELGMVSFAVGIEAGALVLHQNTAWRPQGGYAFALELPGQGGTSNATGLLFGPVAELGMALGPRLFVHVEGGTPYAILRTRDARGDRSRGSGYGRLMLGVGIRL